MWPVSMHLRRCLHASIAGAIVAMSAQVPAQNYPVKPVHLIVPVGPGSSADIGSRFVAHELSNALGQPFIVDNRPGAGGTIGTAELARAAPDGYTIGFVSQSTLVFDQALYAHPGYNSLRDFAPIALLARASNVMVVHPSNTARSASDIIAAARARPGMMTFASGGSGTSQHLAGVLFTRAAGIDLVHVPYKSAPQAVLAVMADEVTLGFFNTPTVITQIRQGALKALGVTSRTRSPLIPDVPTLDEQGLHGYEVDTWAGYVAPAGTPPAIIAKLNAQFAKILETPRSRDKLESQGFEPAPVMSSTAFAQVITDDVARWTPIVRASGAKVD